MKREGKIKGKTRTIKKSKKRILIGKAKKKGVKEGRRRKRGKENADDS